MTSFYYGTGRYMNLLERAKSVSVTSEDVDFPKAGLYDYRASRPFKFSTTANPVTVDVDLEMVPNGDFEAAFASGLPATSGAWGTWSKTAGATCAKGAGGGFAGDSLDVTGASITADYAQLAAVVRPGELLRLTIRNRVFGGGTSADGTAKVTVYIPELGLWLGTDGATWQNSNTHWTQNGSTSYAQQTATFNVPSFATCGYAQYVTIQVRLQAGKSGRTCSYDDMTLQPGVSIASVHGHNLNGGHTVTVQSDDNSSFSSPTTQGTTAIVRPAFYTKFATSYERYWRLNVAGVPSVVVGLGELVLAQAETLTPPTGSSAADWGPVHPERSAWQVEWDRPQERIETGAGDEYVFNRSAHERRTATLPLDGDDATLRHVGEAIWRRSESGLYPILVVPDSGSEDVILGRVNKGRVTTRELAGAGWGSTVLVVRELAFPQFSL